MIRLVLVMMFAAEELLAPIVDRIAASGQVLEIATTPDERLGPPARIAPGAPPLLSFRVLEGRQRHRFGDLDLVLDDAGH